MCNGLNPDTTERGSGTMLKRKSMRALSDNFIQMEVAREKQNKAWTSGKIGQRNKPLEKRNLSKEEFQNALRAIGIGNAKQLAAALGPDGPKYEQGLNIWSDPSKMVFAHAKKLSDIAKQKLDDAKAQLEAAEKELLKEAERAEIVCNSSTKDSTISESVIEANEKRAAAAQQEFKVRRACEVLRIDWQFIDDNPFVREEYQLRVLVEGFSLLDHRDRLALLNTLDALLSRRPPTDIKATRLRWSLDDTTCGNYASMKNLLDLIRDEQAAVSWIMDHSPFESDEIGRNAYIAATLDEYCQNQ